jgi:AraC family transcriptional activator FtrA
MSGNGEKILRGPKVVALVYDRLSMFEFGIVTEVFGLTRPEFGADWYQFSMCSVDGMEITGTGGMSLKVEGGMEALVEADIIVIPGWRTPYTSIPPSLKTQLTTSYNNGARIVGICGGAFVLAAAGLLSGKRATTHWQFVETFIGAYPDVRLETAPLYCADNRLYTSAGSAAGIDLCLYVVQEDYGHAIANVVAKRLVVAPVRPGAQTQDIDRAILPQDKHSQLASLLDWLRLNLATRYTIEDIAQKSNMSVRTFLRHFKQVTGMTYGQWMTLQRIDRAKTLLTETDLSVDTVAEACGYGSTGSFRRAFINEVHASPSLFRKPSRVASN